MGREPVKASEVKAKPVDWLWRERIPKGMVTLIAGRPDTGKGMFAALVAAEVSQRGMNVLYSAMEDDDAMMTKPRLEAAGANLERIILWRFMLPAQRKQMEERVRANNIRLVVIDPMAAHIGGGISKSSDSIRILTNPLTEFAEETGCAFLIVDHQLKRVPKSAHPLTGIAGGSSGLPSVARTAYLFGSDPKEEDRRMLAAVKFNIGPKPKAIALQTDTKELDEVGDMPFLLFEEETDFDASLLLHGDPDGRIPGRPPEKRAAAGEWLARYLFQAGKPVEASLIYEDAKQFGLTSKTLRNSAKDLGIEKDPPGGGRKCKWSLPDEIVQAMTAANKADKKGKKS